MGFSLIDYVIFITYSLLILYFGTRFRKSQKTVNDYFLGGRNIPWLAVSLSIIATETSALTFIGVPAQSYRTDLLFIQLSLGYLTSRIVLSYTFVRVFYRENVPTVYSFLGKRFGKIIQRYTGVLYFITRILASGVRLFAIALVLSVVADVPVPVSIMLIGIVAVFYTIIGGITAVIWTDVIQMIVLIAGGVVAFFFLLNNIPGGWETIVRSAAEENKFRIFDFSYSLNSVYTFWSGLIGGFVFGMATHGTDQGIIQRLLACKSEKGAAKAISMSGVFVIPQFLLFLVIGVMLYVFYHGSFPVDNTDKIFAFFIIQELPRGITGLIIAGVFSAAMSTLDSDINAMASTTLSDFFPEKLKKQYSDKKLLNLSKLFTAFWGIILILVAFLAQGWGSVLTAGLKVASFTAGGMLGIFSMGIFTRKANTAGCLAGSITGIAAVVFMNFATDIAWPWFALAGCAVTWIIGYPVSIITTKKTNKS